MIAPARNRKCRSPKTPIARGIKLPADVGVRKFERGGFREIEVDISADRLARIARAGRVPDEAIDILAGRLKCLIADLTDISAEMLVQRTRRQLRQELIDLQRALRSGDGLPVVPPWLRSEIEGYFIKFRLDLPFGKIRTISSREADAWYQLQDEARAEVRAAFLNPAKLASVIRDVLGFFTRSRPFTREGIASMSAFRPELEIVFSWIASTWQIVLQRDLTNGDGIRDFSIEVLKVAGVSISALSLQRRLQAMTSATRVD